MENDKQAHKDFH